MFVVASSVPPQHNEIEKLVDIIKFNIILNRPLLIDCTEVFHYFFFEIVVVGLVYEAMVKSMGR